MGLWRALIGRLLLFVGAFSLNLMVQANILWYFNGDQWTKKMFDISNYKVFAGDHIFLVIASFNILIFSVFKVLSLSVIIIQSSMIHSANTIHNSSLLPLYKILRAEYYSWRAKIDDQWLELKKKSSASAQERIEKKLKIKLGLNTDDDGEGLESMMEKENIVRENLDLPHLPDYAEMERVSYICGLNGLVGGILQFLSSFGLLWMADRVKYEGHKTIAKIWIAVTGGVLFSLTTCLLALLLQESPVNLVHMSPPSGLLFMILGGDLLLNLYFLWIILAWLGVGGYEHGGHKKYFV